MPLRLRRGLRRGGRRRKWRLADDEHHPDQWRKRRERRKRRNRRQERLRGQRLTTFLLTVAYDGGTFSGFAPQPNARTVAGELLGALRALDPKIAEVRGASRTDAGVHARGQIVAFDSESAIPPRGWVLGTGRHLPREIAVVRAARIADGFTPRFANQGKRYAYRISTSKVRDPFDDGRAWRVRGLDLERLVEAVKGEGASALGTHDFLAFRSSGDERVDTTRTIRRFEASIEPSTPHVARIEVEGNAFLYNMVRILVGTVVEVALGRRSAGAIGRALASRDRKDAGITAPPFGLYLEKVFTSDEGKDAWPNDDAEDDASESEPRSREGSPSDPLGP